MAAPDNEFASSSHKMLSLRLESSILYLISKLPEHDFKDYRMDRIKKAISLNSVLANWKFCNPILKIILKSLNPNRDELTHKIIDPIPKQYLQ